MKSATILTDRTPYSNDGTNSGATIGAKHSTFVAANSDNVRIPDSVSLSLTSTMTAMVWVKGAGQATKGIFAHLDNATNQRGFLLYTSGISPYTKFRIFLSDNGQNIAGHKKEYISSIITFDGTWHLIGFTFDAGILKLFVNGVEDANPTKSTDDPITTIHDSTADIMVGCFLNSDTPVGFFDGDLAYARMYNRALTNAEWLLAFEKQKGEFL